LQPPPIHTKSQPPPNTHKFAAAVARINLGCNGDGASRVRLHFVTDIRQSPKQCLHSPAYTQCNTSSYCYPFLTQV
jgi:hypothetical protein